jgi:flagellar hook-associated protein 3 FlgL
MRITNNTIIRRYTNNLNKSLSNLNNLSESISTGRKFKSASEDTASAIKALRVRRELSRIATYQTNLKDTLGVLDETESSLSSLSDLVTQAKEACMQVVNGTNNGENRKIVADTLANIQSQVFQISNSSFGGKYLFGGSNVEQPPFTLDASGNLLYNNLNVNIANNTTENVYTDLGLGLSLDSLGNVTPDSAFSTATCGNIVLGTGVDASGLPNNLYNLIGKVINDLNNNDVSHVNQAIDKLDTVADSIMSNTVTVGEKSKFIEFLSDRYDNKELNYKDRQNNIEAVDSAKAITNFKEQEMAYNAALQMGSRLLQPSLMDYLD